MRKIKKCIGLLLVAFMVANLCAVGSDEVRAEENVEEFNEKQEETRYATGSLPALQKPEILYYFTSTSSILKFSSFPAISWLASNVIVVLSLAVTFTGNGCPN